MDARSLRVLIVEDSEPDALLVERELRRAGFDVVSERVETATAMRAMLEERQWDLVVSDFSLPQLSAPAALAIVQEAQLDVPFIVVSGTVDEETAVESIRAGAHDFVSKASFARFVRAVKRALSEAASRRERRETERALRATEMRLRRLIESDIVGISVFDSSGTILETNAACRRMRGYSEDDVRAGVAKWAPIGTGVEARIRETLRTEGSAGPVAL